MNVRKPPTLAEVIRQIHIEVRDCRCPCGRMIRIPIEDSFSDPFYVEEVAKRHRHIEECLHLMRKDVMELAQECLDAGVKPAIMRRADELMELFRALKRMHGLEDAEGGC